VTNPSDLTFRSRRLLGLPIGGDNLMRDHRKIVIRDVTEADPAAGEVILTGVGVGEKYASATWEDRGVILQGPAALGAKAMAREVLETNGSGATTCPRPCGPSPSPWTTPQRVAALEATGATARVLQAHNRTGWGPKDATFVQMLLYDLAPAAASSTCPTRSGPTTSGWRSS
jgi:phosphatidylserine/phosphatidylglycerophosphate/cardiolipin synthase-like enzyme